MPEEQKFDRMLQDALTADLPELPPIPEVTPWRDAMERILIGIGLTTITLNFLYLQYILPTLGILMLWLGARTLRRENHWFTGFWAVSALKLAAQFVRLVLLAVPGMEAALTGMAYAAIPFTVFQMLCLWRGIKAVRRAAGQPDDAGAAGALVVWQVVLSALAIIGVSGWLFVLPVLAGYIATLYYLSKVPALLDGAGYTVQAAPVRVSDGAAKGVYLGLLLAGIIGASLFFGRYPMEWTPAPEAEQAGLEEVRAELLDLGFPEAVLDDLSHDDLAALDGAVRVYADGERCYWDADERSYRTNGNIYTRGEYNDERTELVLTHVAVKLPDLQWKTFHHFEWVQMPSTRKTECMEFWPASHVQEPGYGYLLEGDPGGRVLYDRGGMTYESPYHLLEFETYTSAGFFGSSTQTNLFAAFSLPRRGQDCRGYVTYAVEEVNEDTTYFDSWNNYTRQVDAFQYPAMTALDNAKAGFWNYRGSFRTIQSALQFFPPEGVVEPEGLPEYDIGGYW